MCLGPQQPRPLPLTEPGLQPRASRGQGQSWGPGVRLRSALQAAQPGDILGRRHARAEPSPGHGPVPPLSAGWPVWSQCSQSRPQQEDRNGRGPLGWPLTGHQTASELPSTAVSSLQPQGWHRAGLRNTKEGIRQSRAGSGWNAVCIGPAGPSVSPFS